MKRKAWGVFLVYGDGRSIPKLVGKKKKTSSDINGFPDLLLVSKVILSSHK